MKSTNPVISKVPNGWILVPTSEVFSFIKTHAFSRENLANNTGNIQGVGSIHYGDIHSTYSGSSIDLKTTSVPMIRDTSFLPSEEDLLKDGDLVMADASEDYEGVGVTVSIHGIGDKKVIGGLHTYVLRDKKQITSEYYRQYIFRNPKIRNILQKMANGVSVYGISKTVVSGVLLPLPDIQEQNRIIAVLEVWNKVIEALNRKIQLKKEIRNGLAYERVYKSKDSTEIFLDELFELGRGRVISRQEIEKKQGDYPVYSSQTSDNGIFGKINTFDFEGEYLTWTTDGANVGRVFYRSGKFNCTNVCGTAKLKSGQAVSLYFVAIYLNYVTKRYVSYVGNPKLMNGVFGSIQIMLPDYEEQIQIAKIIQCADKEITELENTLTLLCDQRKYLLDNLITGVIRTPVNMVTSSL